MHKWIGLAVGAIVVTGCDLDLNVDGGASQIVGSGKVDAISRRVGSFKSIAVDGSIDADVTIGKLSEARIKGDDNLIKLVKTEIKGDTLHIYLEGNYTTKNELKVTLSAPDIRSAAVAGSGDLAIHNLRSGDISLSIAGSGDIKADGSASGLKAEVAGSGDMSLYGLKVSQAKVVVTGSGDVQVNVSRTLQASVTGSGDIHYKGHPTVQKAITGSGDVSSSQ